MKKYLLLLAALAWVVTLNAYTLYLIPGVWNVHDAKFAIYYFNSEGDYGWSAYMTSVGDAYVGEVPDSYENVIFVRLNPSGGINWESKWNQTADLYNPYANMNCYTITGWGEEDQPSPGEWSYVSIEKIRIGDLYYNLNPLTKTAEVTSENDNWPYWSSTLTNAVIPAKVTYYFDDETYNVTSIGMYAFYGCKGLTTVSIPNSVIKLAGEAFEDCTWLTSIDVASDNPIFSSANGVLFNKDKSILLFYPRGKSGHYTVPNSVTYIGEHAFEESLGLTSITIPNNVNGIGYNAFKGCYNLPIYNECFYADTYLVEVTNTDLTECSIKEGTKWIGNDAFFDCQIMTSVIIPKSVFSIGARAFDRCIKLRSVTNYAVSPQPIMENVFWAIDKSKCTLCVPAESINAYKTADQWKEFNPILSAPPTEGIYNPSADLEGLNKILRNGQILILRGDKTYTLQGQEVK